MEIERMRYAYRIGRARHYRDRAKGIPDQAIIATPHTDGCAGVAECFVADTLGIDWPRPHEGRPDFPWEGDLPGIQIRWTHRLNGCLPVKPKDNDEFIGVLVVGEPPTQIRIVGYLPIRECKQQRFWREDIPLPAYLVPQNHLLPLANNQ